MTEVEKLAAIAESPVAEADAEALLSALMETIRTTMEAKGGSTFGAHNITRAAAALPAAVVMGILDSQRVLGIPMTPDLHAKVAIETVNMVMRAMDQTFRVAREQGMYEEAP